MKAQLYTKLTITLLSIIGVSSVITPASANLTNNVTNNIKPVIGAATEQKPSSKVEEKTNTTVGKVVSASSNSQAKTETGQTSNTPNLLLTNEIKSALEATADQNITSKIEEKIKTTVGEVVSASNNSQAKTEAGQISDTSNPLITNEIKSAIDATVDQKITSNAKETTQTTVEKIAGASSDSQVKIQTEEVKDLDIPPLSQPKDIITHKGEAEIKGEINQEEINSQIKVDKEISVNKVGTVDICLDGEASVGSSGNSSLANCNGTNQAKSVPEPTSLAGIVMLGGYLVYRRCKSSSSSLK